MESIKNFFKTFLLFELMKGMALTGRYFFARKITVQFPEEKTPQSFRFRGLHAQRRFAVFARNPARWTRSSRRACSNITAKNGVTCITPSRCCWRSATNMKSRSPGIAQRMPSTDKG